MEIIKLRPHHATEIKQRLECKTDPEDFAELLNRLHYDTQTILIVLNILQKVRNPMQLIEILPDEDLANDPICQNCVTKRKISRCDKPLLPGRIGKDGFEGLRFGLRQGEQFTVEQLMKKKEAFGPHFRI